MADDLQSKAADLIKKALTVGVGAVFLTEENIRSLISELKLPKEMITGLFDSATRSRTEFFQKLSQDLIDRITSAVDPEALMKETFEKYEFQITVRVKPKSGEE